MRIFFSLLDLKKIKNEKNDQVLKKSSILTKHPVYNVLWNSSFPFTNMLKFYGFQVNQNYVVIKRWIFISFFAITETHEPKAWIGNFFASHSILSVSDNCLNVGKYWFLCLYSGLHVRHAFMGNIVSSSELWIKSKVHKWNVPCLF